jgi:hypothetical protein
MLTFTNFMSNLEAIVAPKMEKRLSVYGFKREEIVYLFDNASTSNFYDFHNSLYSFPYRRLEWLVNEKLQRI